ncbi:DUF11 domain-containing protein [Pseudanabaena biceps]|nr:DUF11 domain-containing protein [Pseudanabaena biceps]
MASKRKPNQFQNQFQIFSKLVVLFWQGILSVFGRSLLPKSNFKLKKLQHKQIQKDNQNIRKTRAVKLMRSLFTVIMTLVLTISLSGINLWFTLPAYAAGLYIEPITWDFVGLDSNNVNVGPNNFLLAARVCNTNGIGGSPLTNINVQYQRTGAFNPFVTVTAINGVNIDTVNIPSLPSGVKPPNHQQVPNSGSANITPSNCFDAYFNIVVSRDSAAYRTVQQYRLVASAAGAGSVDTNTALASGITGYTYGTSVSQQIYVEKILSQSRNSVVSFSGPSSVFVGDTVEYVLTTKTATAYPQLTVSTDFPNGLIQLVDVKTTYSSDPSVVSSGVYFDACGWIADPSNVGYNTSANTCDGPVLDQDLGAAQDGKVGNDVITRYRVKILSTGIGSPPSSTITVNHLINDFSGGSFHYNADYGFGIGTSQITINDSTTDLQIVKSHTGNFATGNNTYQLQVKNNGPTSARGTLTVVDTLPTGFSYVSASSSDPWTCSAAGQIVTCTNPNSTNFAVSATSTINLVVNVGATAATYSLNTATVTSGSPDSNLANNSSSDPTTVLSGANISLTKTHSPATFIVGSTGTYTLTVSNSSAFDGIGPIVIADKLPTGISYISGSGASISYPATTAPSGCSIASGTVTCPWTVSASGQNVTFQNNANLVVGASSIVTLNVAIGSSALPSVINTATATTTNYDPSTSNNTATDTAPVVSPIPDLQVTKSHLDSSGNPISFTAAGLNKYTITVKNVGVAPTTGAISVVETFPAGAGMTYKLSPTTAGGTVLTNGWSSSATDGSAGSITFTNAGPLAAGVSSSFDIIVSPTTAGTYGTVSGFASSTITSGNKVVVSTTGDTNTANDTYYDATVVVTAPTNTTKADAIVAKTVFQSPTPSNRTVIYQIVVTDHTQGSSGTDTFTFSDVIPSQISSLSFGNNATSYNNSICTFAGGNGNGTPTCSLSFSGNTLSGSVTLKKNDGNATFFIKGTLATGYAGTLPNTASVNVASGFTDENPSDNISTASFSYNEADLTITKTPANANVIRGGTANFTIAVKNDGTGSTSGVITVTDTLNADLTFIQGSSAALSSGWSCSAPTKVSGQTQLVTCTNPGPLAAGASSSISLQATVSGTATLGTAIPNTASVSTPNEVTTNNNTSAIANVTPIAANSDLIISKSGPATTNLGQNLTYSLTVTNQGTTSAIASTNPITVTDTLQSGLTFLSGTGSGWSCSAAAQVVTCTSNTDLAPSDTSVITLNTLVGTSTVSPINNSASISLVGETVTNNNNSLVVVTTINQSADLSVVKSHTDNFVLGQSANYKLLVTNNGPSSVPSTITVVDTLPNDLAFVSSTGGGFTCTAPAKVNGTPQVVTCTNAAGLVVGTSATITLNVTVGAATPTGTNSITNTATVSSAVSDPVSSNNTSTDPTTISPLQADLKLTKTRFGTFAIGGQGTYTLAVQNLGPALATGTLTITDTLPANLTLASFIGQGWTCTTIGSASVSCTNPNASGLASGSTTAVNITVNIGVGTPVGTNSITNTANLNVPAYDLISSNNTASNPTTISGSADLTVTKTTTSTFVLGQQAVYTIKVTNNGSSTSVAPITLVDQLPTGLTYVSAAGINWTCPASSTIPDITCTYSVSLTSGASASDLIFTVNVVNLSPSANPTSYTNFVTVYGPTSDPNTDNNVAQVTNPRINPVPSLNLVKRITNINNVDITGFISVTASGLSNDADPKWPTPTQYLRGGVNCNASTPCTTATAATITGGKPGDLVEYTIYFLSNGTENLKNAQICDAIPANTTFEVDTYTTGKGILLGWDSTGGVLPDPANSTLVTNVKVALTNLSDSDTGKFLAINTAESGAPSPCSLATNARGAVLVKFGLSPVIPSATSSGTPKSSYGFVRFKVKVN